MSAQSANALVLANERRSVLKILREQIEALPLPAGCHLAAAVLDEPSDHEAAMPVGRLLLAIDRFGIHTLAPLLKTSGVISADRRVRDLTDRQRTVIASALRRRATTYRSRDRKAEPA